MLGVLLLCLGQSPAASEPVVVTSAHYRILAYPPFTEAEEYARLAEALYAQLESYFGARPDPATLLEVRFWPDAQSYKLGGAQDGIPEGPLSAGGLYWTGTARAYFWRQPSANFTRHLFLHELTHQFQFLAVMHNEARAPAWYGEGLAEHFGYHRWDGHKLETGVEDVLGLEQDIPRLAEQGRADEYDLEAVLDGRAGADKPPSWAAVHYLIAGPDAELTRRFHALEKRIWSGELAGPELAQSVLGSERATRRTAVNQWLAQLPTTWKIEWIHWDTRGAEIVGESSVVALVRSRASFEQGAFVESTLHEESGSAGLVLAFRSTEDFIALYRRPTGRLELVQRTSGGWKNLAAASGPEGASVRLRAEISSSGCLRATSAGRELLRVELGEAAVRGCVGLFADAGRTRFSDVQLPAAPPR